MTRSPTLDRRGVALLLTLLLALVVTSIAIGVLLMISNSNLVTRFHVNEAVMANAAEAALEQVRDSLNGSPGLVPVIGVDTLEFNAPVRDAAGAVIAGITRSLYLGPTGAVAAEFGHYASVVAAVRDVRGAVVIRRLELRETSYAGWARFYDTWSGSWGPTDVVFGPVHSNQGMALSLGSPGAIFNGPVTTVGTITNQGRGTWNGGVQTGVAPIPFPTAADIASLQPVAVASNTLVDGYPVLNAVDPDLRIEFVAIDLNGDGDEADDTEGYFRVFRTPSGGTSVEQQRWRNYVTARRWLELGGTWPSGGLTGSTAVTPGNDPNMVSPNCGGQLDLGTGPTWLRADSILTIFGTGSPAQPTVAAKDSIRAALRTPQRRCYLGGDPGLFRGRFVVTTPYGSFLPWPGWSGSPPTALVNAIPPGMVDPSTDAASVAETLWPLSRTQNPNYHGLIYVTGSVAVSGRVRGRVTLAAAGNIVLADDITYVRAPNTTCDDILGLVTDGDVVLEDNSINTPSWVQGLWTAQFDDTPTESFHGFFLALGTLRADNLFGEPGPLAPENCGGKSRGCVSITGGTTLQRVPVTFSGTTGWAEQDTYDHCGRRDPPPYFPTTGRYTRHKYYELDPVGFDPAAWYAANQ